MSDTFTIATHGSIAGLLAARTRERAEFPLVHVEDEGPWTVGALAAHATDMRDRLEAEGVEPGQRVLLRLGNDERFIAALLGVWLRGASAIAMHPRTPHSEARRVLDAMQAVAVVGQAEDDVLEVGQPLLLLDRLATDASAPADLAVPDIDDTDEALVLLTSGTTGDPKGVVLTHGAAWSNLRDTVSAFRSDPTPTRLPDEPRPPNLIANPMSHTAGVVRLLFALYVGRGIVLLRKFDATKAHAALIRHGINNLTINPAMIRMLLEDLPPDADLGEVRYISSGTAPLPPALREAFEERFGLPVLQAYGQTEAFGGIAIESVKDVLEGRRRPGSVGRPLPGVELRIATDAGDHAATGEDGEIWVRTSSATAGYLGSTDSPLDADGWLRTGDLGHLDGEGYLYVTGRVKNLIIAGGFNIVPEEVEAVLARDPQVREAAVVGLPDERLGELPVALYEGDADPDALADRLRQQLAPYKVPRRLHRVDELPRVPNGKVDRSAVVALATELSAAEA